MIVGLHLRPLLPEDGSSLSWTESTKRWHAQKNRGHRFSDFPQRELPTIANRAMRS